MHNQNSNTTTTLQGSPWPRLWQPKDVSLYQNDSYFKDVKKSYSRAAITCSEDILPIRKYYRKNLNYLIITNAKIPRNLKNRIKHVKDLKVFSNANIKCPFSGVRKLALNMHSATIQPNPWISKMIRDNKHIVSLKVSNFETFNAFLPSIKSLPGIKTFYLDVKNHSLRVVETPLSSFVQRCKVLRKLGLFLEDVIPEEGEKNANIVALKALMKRRQEASDKILGSIVGCKTLRILKIDFCSPVLLESQGLVGETLLLKLAQKKLEAFDIRLLVKGSLNFTGELAEFISQLDYLAIATQGEEVPSVFGDSAERLSYHRKSKKILMMNFESSPKVDILTLFQHSSSHIRTIDVQYKGENQEITTFSHLLTSLPRLSNLLLYFDSCSSGFAQTIESLSKNVPKLSSVKRLAVLFKNIVYTQDSYNNIKSFLSSLQQINYLNLMLHHNIRTSKLSPVKIDLDQIYSSLTSLPQLKTLKVSANPPWDDRPLLCLTPSLSALPQLENLSLFLWLKTESRVLFSLPISSLAKIKDLTLSIYFKIDDSFINSLIEQLGHLKDLECLNFSVAYYNKFNLNQFQELFKKLGGLKKLQQVQLNINVINEERDKKVNLLQETMRRGHAQNLETTIDQINKELEGEKKELKNEIGKFFEGSTRLKKVLFLHAAKQYFSAAYSRKV